MSQCNLRNSEISLLSKGLKFVPTRRGINKTLIKEELEVYGGKRRLMWHFRNERGSLVIILLRKNLSFDPKRKDAAIQLYLSRLEEEISSLDCKAGYSDLIQGERDVICPLKNDNSIIIKEADKGSAVVKEQCSSG